MSINKEDIKLLAMFAYNRTLVRHYDEALAIYRFLSSVEENEFRWKLGAGLCLIQEGDYQEAQLWLHAQNPQTLAADQNDLLTRLHQHVAHHQKNSTKENHQQ